MAIGYFLELFTTSNPNGLEEVMKAVECKINTPLVLLKGLNLIWHLSRFDVAFILVYNFLNKLKNKFSIKHLSSSLEAL